MPRMGRASVSVKFVSSTVAIWAMMNTAMTAATGKFFQNPRLSVSTSMSSIITTNRNSTMTAPTYTSTSVMERNSAFSSIQMAEAWKNDSTRNSTA